MQGVDTLAGVEAIISHLFVKVFQIPCAHAPALLPVPLSHSLAPKSAAEEVVTFSDHAILFHLSCQTIDTMKYQPHPLHASFTVGDLLLAPSDCQQ